MDGGMKLNAAIELESTLEKQVRVLSGPDHVYDSAPPPPPVIGFGFGVG